MQHIKKSLLIEMQKKGKLLSIWQCSRCYKKIPFYKSGSQFIDAIYLMWAKDHEYCSKCEKKNLNKLKEDKMPEIKKFSDVYGQESFDFPGEQVNEKNIRNKQITIYDFAILNGQYGEFAVVDAELLEETEIEGKTVKRVQFAEGSEVIVNQLKKVKKDGNLPILAKIEERTSDKSKMNYRTLC